MEAFVCKMIIAVLILLSCIHVFTVNSHVPPHIVLVVSDDLGWNDVSFHNPTKEVPTPNIDTIAADGVILNHYYTGPSCTPSRSSLMTGKYAIRLGLQNNTILSSTPFGLSLKEKILPEYLKSLNYVTHGVGKWNLGHFKKEYLPMNRGFDNYFGYWNAAKDYYSHVCIEKYTNYTGYDLHDNFDTAWEYNGTYATELFTTKAQEIIQNHNSSKPLFLYIAHQAPHGGNPQTEVLQVPKKYTSLVKSIKDKTRRQNAAMVLALDVSVGKVFWSLEDSGMLDNTVFVFINDNGANINGLEGTMGSNFPLKGGKGNLWEGGVRTVGVVWSSALRNNSRVFNGLMHVTDWLPTLISAAAGNTETSFPADVDGKNLWPSFTRGVPSPREDVLINLVTSPPVEGYRWRHFKIVKGSYLQGRADLWSDESGKTIGSTVPEQKPDSILKRYKKKYKKYLRNSEAARILYQKYGKNLLSALTCTIPGCDSILNISQCGTAYGRPFPPLESHDCKPNNSSCLFNLEADPCEYHNIANDYPEVLKQLEEAIDSYRPFVLNNVTKSRDPKADPSLHGGVWNPWM